MDKMYALLNDRDVSPYHEKETCHSSPGNSFFADDFIKWSRTWYMRGRLGDSSQL